MSVILRLQNLPWSATSIDIRQFFKNLLIPEGGVHIVGGQLGDAFIIFSSDEDARQAMLMNGGMLKEERITLFLSSRSEMQKVIEMARNPHPIAPEVPMPDTNKSVPMDRDPKDSDRRNKSRRSRSRSRDRDDYSNRRRHRSRSRSRSRSRGRSSRGRRDVDRRRSDKSKYDRGSPRRHSPDRSNRSDRNSSSRDSKPKRDPFNDNSSNSSWPANQGAQQQSIGYGRDQSYPERDQYGSSTDAMPIDGRLPNFQNTPGNNISPTTKPGTFYVELRGFPLTAHEYDVKEFLYGIHIPANGIKFEADAGRRHGSNSIYVKLSTSHDHTEALKRHKRYHGHNMIEVYVVKEEFVCKFFDGPQNKVTVGQESCCIMLKNLPLQCQESDVYAFFPGLTITKLFIVKNETGNSTGDAYVEFQSPIEAANSLKNNQKKIFHRYILLSSVPKEAMVAVMPPEDPFPKVAPIYYPVLMQGLPFNASDRDIAEFFSGLSLNGIYILLTSNGMATGEAFAEFQRKSDANMATSKNSQYMGLRQIVVKSVSYPEMQEILSNTRHITSTMEFPKVADLDANQPGMNLLPNPNQPLIPNTMYGAGNIQYGSSENYNDQSLSEVESYNIPNDAMQTRNPLGRNDNSISAFNQGNTLPNMDQNQFGNLNRMAMNIPLGNQFGQQTSNHSPSQRGPAMQGNLYNQTSGNQGPHGNKMPGARPADNQFDRHGNNPDPINQRVSRWSEPNVENPNIEPSDPQMPFLSRQTQRQVTDRSNRYNTRWNENSVDDYDQNNYSNERQNNPNEWPANERKNNDHFGRPQFEDNMDRPQTNRGPLLKMPNNEMKNRSYEDQYSYDSPGPEKRSRFDHDSRVPEKSSFRYDEPYQDPNKHQLPQNHSRMSDDNMTNVNKKNFRSDEHFHDQRNQDYRPQSYNQSDSSFDCRQNRLDIGPRRNDRNEDVDGNRSRYPDSRRPERNNDFSPRVPGISSLDRPQNVNRSSEGRNGPNQSRFTGRDNNLENDFNSPGNRGTGLYGRDQYENPNEIRGQNRRFSKINAPGDSNDDCDRGRGQMGGISNRTQQDRNPSSQFDTDRPSGGHRSSRPEHDRNLNDDRRSGSRDRKQGSRDQSRHSDRYSGSSQRRPSDDKRPERSSDRRDVGRSDRSSDRSKSSSSRPSSSSTDNGRQPPSNMSNASNKSQVKPPQGNQGSKQTTAEPLKTGKPSAPASAAKSSQPKPAAINNSKQPSNSPVRVVTVANSTPVNSKPSPQQPAKAKPDPNKPNNTLSKGENKNRPAPKKEADKPANSTKINDPKNPKINNNNAKATSTQVQNSNGPQSQGPGINQANPAANKSFPLLQPPEQNMRGGQMNGPRPRGNSLMDGPRMRGGLQMGQLGMNNPNMNNQMMNRNNRAQMHGDMRMIRPNTNQMGQDGFEFQQARNDRQSFLRDMGPSRPMRRDLGQNRPNLDMRRDLGQGRPDLEIMEQSAVDTFGRPGCVVGASNIPYNANVGEILNFFRGFNVSKDSVIRRFNEQGMVTGDARIAFRNANEAMAAVKELNNMSIGGRSVSLFLV